MFEADEHFRLVIDHPLAEIMEYGTIHQAPMPFIRPAIIELSSQAELLYEMGGIEKVIESFKAILRKNLAKYGKSEVAEHIRFERVTEDDDDEL